MRYKFKKNQLFRKKLEMPERIVNKVYNCTLSFQEYMEYNLEEKEIPITCLNEVHRMVVEKFGVERSKGLDWELIDLKGSELTETLEDISENAENINEELYKFVRTDMRPRDYTPMMRKAFSDFVLEDDGLSENVKSDFNSGFLKINDLVKIWEHVKDKDLSLCLKNDYYNKENVTEDELKRFMVEYNGLLSLLDDPTEIYTLIITIYRSDELDENKNAYIKKIVDKILEKTIDNGEEELVSLTGEQYKIIFEYTSVREYIYKKLGNERADNLLRELGDNDVTYLLELTIPFNVLIDENVLKFIEIYGLENIINFDEECGHFFSNNDSEMLKVMYDMYIKNAVNEPDSNRSFFTKKPYGITGNYIERGYTKDEFYEAIRRMIVYGPTDMKYEDRTSDYRYITGEFRELNPELFVDIKSPEEFQDAFYNKTLTPIFVRDHYNCISYLIGKKLSTIFSPLSVRLSKSEDGYYYRFENIYRFLEEKLGFEETIKIITDYADVFEILFSSYEKITESVYIAPIQFSNKDTLTEIINKINDKLYELIIKANIKYSSKLSKSMKEKYPYVFISYKANKELHDLFYNREINAKYIIEHPEYKQFFEGLDIELFFSYMPIVLLNTEEVDENNNNTKRIENLISFVKQLFGNEEGLSILLAYHIYLDKINEKMGFSKVEFRDNITKEEFLVQIDCLIYLNIIRGDILYDDNMPMHFKAAYPALFLDDNTPDEIKHKFYNRLFNLDDFYADPVLLKYFANTDIACCLDTTFSCMIGLFTSNDFLEVIKNCGEEIKSDTKLFTYIRSKTDDMINTTKLGEFLYSYFKENEQTLRYVMLLKKLGIDSDIIDDLSNKFSKVIMLNPSLDVNSPSMNGMLLNNEVIDKYGYDVITNIMSKNSGAHKVIIESLEDELLPNWINYLKRQPIYDTTLVHYAFLVYNDMKELINELVSKNIDLNSNQLINLKNILLSKNKFIVQNMNDLTKYNEYCDHILDEKINSGNLNVVRDGMLEKLFNTSLKDVNRIFTTYGLYSVSFEEEYLNFLSLEDKAIVKIIRELYEADDTESLRKRFKEIKAVAPLKSSLKELEDKLKGWYAKKINEVLFKDENESKGLTRSQISGLDTIGFKNINGDYITSQSKIDVVTLEGIKFNLLVYSLPGLNKEFENGSMKVLKKPGEWLENKDEVLLMNLISNTHFGCVNHGHKTAVYYGFNEISETALDIMSRRDIVVENNLSNLRPTSSSNEFMIPEMLQVVSSSYNTIGIKANSGKEDKYNHRIIPNCIVCFDNNINLDSKRAAQYFNIPIYVIDREKYNNQNDELTTKYKDGIRLMEENNVWEIFCNRALNIQGRYKTFLKSVDDCLGNKAISKDKYNSLITEAKKIINAYSIHNDISQIDLKEIDKREEEE